MKKFIATLTASILTIGIAHADGQRIDNDLEKTLAANLSAAQSAFENNNFQSASLYLRTAAENAGLIDLKRTKDLAANATPQADAENRRFALTGSSAQTFKNFIEERKLTERRFKNGKGKVVSVRLFDQNSDINKLENDKRPITSDTSSETVLLALSE